MFRIQGHLIFSRVYFRGSYTTFHVIFHTFFFSQVILSMHVVIQVMFAVKITA